MLHNASTTIDSKPWAAPSVRTALLAGGAISFAALTALSAFVRIPLPFTPVPVTLQVFIVLLSGAVLGRGWGAASQGLYVGAGVLGLPVFAGTAGLAVLAGPTAGYLLGFVLAPGLVGWLISSKHDLLHITGAMAAGVAAIYICGWAWLAFGLHMGPLAAFFAGVHPFLIVDLAKAAAAAALFMPVRRMIRLPL